MSCVSRSTASRGAKAQQLRTVSAGVFTHLGVPLGLAPFIFSEGQPEARVPRGSHSRGLGCLWTPLLQMRKPLLKSTFCIYELCPCMKPRSPRLYKMPMRSCGSRPRDKLKESTKRDASHCPAQVLGTPHAQLPGAGSRPTAYIPMRRPSALHLGHRTEESVAKGNQPCSNICSCEIKDFPGDTCKTITAYAS